MSCAVALFVFAVGWAASRILPGSGYDGGGPRTGFFWLSRAQVGVSAATPVVVAAGVALHGRNLVEEGAEYADLARECFIVYGASLILSGTVLFRAW